MAGAQDLEPHQQASVLALAKAFTPTEEKTTAFGHAEPGVPQVAAFLDTAEPCLYSVYTATVLAAVDALLCWARATANEYWCAPVRAPCALGKRLTFSFTDRDGMQWRGACCCALSRT